MVAKPDNLISGFRATGIWPLDKQKILNKVEERGLYKAASESLENPSEPQIEDPNVASTSNAIAGSSTEQSNVLVSAVRDILRPEQDAYTKRGIENSKNKTRVKKKFGEIITSDEAVSAMRNKAIAKSTKKGKKGKAKKNEDLSDDSDNQPIITRFFKKTSEKPATNKKLKTSDSNPSRIDSDKNYFQFLNKNEAKTKLKQFWDSISPPVPEDDILGKWYIGIYKDPKLRGRQTFCIGKAVRRFLEDAEGPVTGLQLDCLKPRVGNTTVLDEYPEGHGDIDLFNITDVFGGPLDIQPLPKRKWNIPNLVQIIKFYEIIAKIDRSELFNSSM